MIRHRFRDRRGGSLIEMVTVLVIIGILCAVLIPGFLNGLPLRRLKADAVDVANNMKYARMKGVARNQKVGLYFFPDEEAYSVYVDSNENNQFDNPGDELLKNKVLLRGGVSLDRDSASWTINGNNTVLFSPNGSATTASGTAVLVNNRSEIRKVSVTAITGRIRIEKEDS